VEKSPYLLVKQSVAIRLVIFLTVLVQSVSFGLAQEQTDSAGINYRYKQIYGFVTMPDTIYTFESEFVLPDGFRHADSSELTPFQNYVANFPLWHRFMPVGSSFGKRVYEREQISRPVHLPYSGPAYTDKAAPIRILAEYLLDHNREFELSVIPDAGDTMTYQKWLTHDIFYGPTKNVQFKQSNPKDTSLKEYYTFMRFCLENTSYKSLAYNCDSITAAELRPGDLFVANDENGRKGVVYVVMHMIQNAAGQKLYAVATGCERACDFHIPLFNGDKNNPWISADKILELGHNFPHLSFLRLKIS
jgi:hypothetical protein